MAQASLVPQPIGQITATALKPGSDGQLKSHQAAYLPAPLKTLSDNDLKLAPRVKLEWEWNGAVADPSVGPFAMLVKTRKSWADDYAEATDDGAQERLRNDLSYIASVAYGDQFRSGFFPDGTPPTELGQWLLARIDAKLPRDLGDPFFPWGATRIPASGVFDPPDTEDMRFVDYFDDPASDGSGGRTMEYTNQFTYAVASYIELPDSTVADPRLLISSFTPESPPQFPIIPDWSVTAAPVGPPIPISALLPELELELALKDARPDLGLDSRLGFHCLMLRKLLLPNEQVHWVPLGNPVILMADAKDKSVSLDAGEIARIERDAPIELILQARIGMFLEVDGRRVPAGGTLLEEFAATIARPMGTNEVRLKVPLEIKLG